MSDPLAKMIRYISSALFSSWKDMMIYYDNLPIKSSVAVDCRLQSPQVDVLIVMDEREW